MPHSSSNFFELVAEVYIVLLEPGQVMLEVSAEAEAEADDDVPDVEPVAAGVAVTVTADGLSSRR